MSESTLKGVSIRGLEVFEALAQTGSVASAADRLGMSAPAVSQQLKNLDAVLGVDLIDHSRRPMTLTPAGRLFLKRVETALSALRMGQRDVVALDLSGLSSLRMGVIEDFENEVTPTLTSRLAETMQSCAFHLETGASHAIQARIGARELDIAICAAGRSAPSNTRAHLLLNDPYILAVPRGTNVSGGLDALSDMAFLRRDMNQIMGKQIEDYLGRHGWIPPQRFEMDSNQSISALVAGGQGWTITTPLSLLRAGRFAAGIEAHSLPDGGIARQIVLYASEDWTGDIPAQIARIARELIALHFITPGLTAMPWLAPEFVVLD
ncbi:LysR family transcriptional regulator [Rhodophyticola sp. CCM32]|uniref:LysR family transcriptional regulator n=1 Tax=Rhodophyticola sp. CCM32 TaxID=2916397 RepID=UPI00107FC0DC|nr:LysR family transcriptional regulator [Rhodophyticola sp. CCM32]QBX99425.1 LysR family transcriptional regulator [Rhodophyticola sp. CCM32]